MSEPRHTGGQCLYGKPIHGLCIEPGCKHPAMMCEEGFNSKQECGQFHESCQKVLWSRVEDLVNHNPNIFCPDFQVVQNKIDNLFAALLGKLRHEHAKFRYWVKTYGYGLEVMKFIKNLGENNFEGLTGASLSPVFAEMANAKRMALPNISEHSTIVLQAELLQQMDKIPEIYLKLGAKKEKEPTTYPNYGANIPSVPSVAVHVQNNEPKHGEIDSRIIHDLSILSTFFEQKIIEFRLLYRASQNGFSIKEFHKKCDGNSGTVTLIETEFGKIIGGFTPVIWSSAKKQWAADKAMKSFVFSINMREKFPLNLVQFAIANNPEKGPIFGCCDICVVNNANKERSNAEFPISYNNGKHVRSPDSCFAFTGHPKGQFLVKEWEVFKVTLE